MSDERFGDLLIQKVAEGAATTGRRESVEYFDLGATEATGGKLSAHFVRTNGVQEKATGWHYHGLDAQLIYMFRGWVDIQFEDGTTRRIDEGDFAIIPGGLRHNQIAKSTETEAIEIALGELTTVSCDPPEGSPA